MSAMRLPKNIEKEDDRFYFYETKLSEELVVKIINFAEKKKETLDACIQAILSAGLDAREEQEGQRKRCSKILGTLLEETEEKPQGAVMKKKR